MNAPTTKTATNTDEAQFLAPEPHQNTNLDERIKDEHGPEIHRYFSTRYRALLSVRSSGVTLGRTLGEDWHVVMRRKPDVAPADWLRSREALYAGLDAWKREVTELPTLEDLMEQEGDGVCETPTGYRVEPDGTGPDGVPSWLRVLGFI